MGNVSLLWGSSDQYTIPLLKKRLSKLRHYSPKLKPYLSTVQLNAIGTENSHLAFIAYFGAITLQALFHNSIKQDFCDSFIIP